MYFLLDESLTFPSPELADEDGLLAIGGDLRPERLLKAYSKGIFPWFNEDDPILWFCPHQRCVLFPEKVKISDSMQQIMKSNRYSVTQNKAFDRVIKNCSTIERVGQEGTWITSDMQAAYISLHELGKAVSIEVWEGDELVGGLYGVINGAVFCGESMFSKRSNASKLALITLCRQKEYKLIDCQIPNDHLLRMGAEIMDYETFKTFLS